MRTLFTIVALVLALAVVGLLARQQLSGSHSAVSGLPTAPGVAPGANMGHAAPPAQQVQQVKQTVDALMQQPRVLPDDTK
ncbi:hypothetical protein [Giesbergeria anulus]|uniref:Uncharacterized protein n=1 Tax=Giesbergeria anulus TaxID=180197 RepID=A0A1H9HFV8_9BURK|nr:hypothetical protein [Giesbergeria anulus]SEQ61205.1 hypothetical protein SAMN02982919_00802 [Giesbergeria anulus]